MSPLSIAGPYSFLGLFAGLTLSPTKSAPVNCFKPALGPAPVDGCKCALFGANSLNSQAKSAQSRQKFTNQDTDSLKHLHYSILF